MFPLYQARDNAEADVVSSLLKGHGIEAVVQGYNHRSLLGFVGPYIELNVLVPDDRIEEARQILSALLPKDSRARPARMAPRNKLLACLLAFIFPGFGSLYLRRHLLGFFLISATAGLFVALLTDERSLPYAAFGLAGVLLCDLVSALNYRRPSVPTLVSSDHSVS